MFTPWTLIGRSIANTVTTTIEAGVGDAAGIGEDLEIVALPVQPGSELAGRTVAQSGIHERTGVTIVGAWFRGKFVSPPSPETLIDQPTVLLVAGEESQIEALKKLTLTDKRRLHSGPVIVGGLGEGGWAVVEVIPAAGYECRTITAADGPQVEIVGDVTHRETILAAGIEDPGTVVLALSEDTTAVVATLAIGHLDPDVEIIARANETASVRKLYGAGADSVLTGSTVSGRMLASTILGEDILTSHQQIAVVRADVGPFAGWTLAEADIRARTGVTVVVERGGDLRTDVGPDVELAPTDGIIIAGRNDAVTGFSALVGDGPPGDQ